MKILTDVNTINAIANVPDIRWQLDALHHIPDDQLLDLKEFTQLPRYVFLSPDDETGFILIDQHAPGMAELHTALTGECRGKRAVEFGREVIKHLLSENGLMYVIGWTPINLRAAHWFNRQCGMREMGIRIHPVTNQECRVFIQTNKHTNITEEHIWPYVL